MRTDPRDNSLVLGPIALSLSGGGYRAAAFHLGTLQTLHDLELLDSVRTLSTVSGGSIAGGSYAASLAAGIPFAEFRADFYDFLRNTNVISKALEKLTNTRLNSGSSSMPSLIRSAADGGVVEAGKAGGVGDA